MRLFAVLVLLWLPLSSILAQNDEVDQVQAAFQGYRAAILNDRGEEAVEYLDRRNFTYYDAILDHIRVSDSTTVAELRFIERFMVLRMRQVNTQEEITRFTDSTFIVYAINEGMIGKDGVSNLQLGEIEITDDFAAAAVIFRGEKTPLKFHFYREAGEWGLDLTHTMTIGQVAIRQAITDSGMVEREFLYLLLEVLSGKAVDETVIWRPTLAKLEKEKKSE
ncbi:MAG: hypothetical protein AAF433_06495 [Bacteroidota bacterium]